MKRAAIVLSLLIACGDDATHLFDAKVFEDAPAPDATTTGNGQWVLWTINELDPATMQALHDGFIAP